METQGINKSKLKFYADTPNGETNKLFCYDVQHGIHSIDLLEKFKARGFKVRSAWHVFPNGKSQRIDKSF